MNTDLIKHITFFSLFIVCINISGKIMLDENDKLVSPLPKPYDGIVYSVDNLKSFIASTVKSDKQPIIIFGANWCPDCRIFSGTMDIPKIKSYIDVKRYEINMQLMEEFGIPSAEGIPRVLVFDKRMNLINNSNTAEWRTARERSSQEIFDFFQNMTTN